MLIILLLVASAVVLMAVSIEFLPAPFVWSGLLGAVLFSVIAIIEKRPRLRALWVNLMAVVLTLALAEGYFWFQNDKVSDERFEGSYTTDYFRAHDQLGYAPAKDYRASVTKYVGEELIYDTVYTIDARGLRVAPPYNPALANSAVLFFGGSITFGEGMPDTLTMPYQVGLKTEGRFTIYNFGFHGYGPHQMLATLQYGLVDELVERPPSLVIYQAIPAHVPRSAGRSSWDREGPRYLIDERGDLYLAGRFNDEEASTAEEDTSPLNHSFLYRRLFSHYQVNREMDLRLYLAIVKAARDEVARRFPGCSFKVLLWGDPKTHDGATFVSILDGLKAADIPVYRISDILPGYTDRPEQYELSPKDRHPTAQAHALIAEFVAKQMLGMVATADR